MYMYNSQGQKVPLDTPQQPSRNMRENFGSMSKKDKKTMWIVLGVILAIVVVVVVVWYMRKHKTGSGTSSMGMKHKFGFRFY